MNLEAELRALDIDWPATPAFELALEPRRRRRGRPLVAVAFAAAAVAAAFAVPQSRGAILRFFHLGGATIRLVDTLPRAEERPLTDGLGPVVPLADARRIVPGLLLPPLDPPPALHLAPGMVVSTVFRDRGSPVLLSQFPGGVAYLKKLATGGSRIDGIEVGGTEGLWIHGQRHVVYFPQRSPRLAGNILLWTQGETTYRLEGPALTRDQAVELAVSLRKG
jgi:hypothetical protein